MTDEEYLAGRLTDAGHKLKQRVYFEDTDFSGRVYHARYLHFMERGRSDFIRLLGIAHSELANSGLVFAVFRMEIDFLRPATIDDVLTINTGTVAVGGARIELRQEVARGLETLVSAHVTIALVRSDGRPARLPEAIRTAFASYSGADADGASYAGRRHGSERG